MCDVADGWVTILGWAVRPPTVEPDVSLRAGDREARPVLLFARPDVVDYFAHARSTAVRRTDVAYSFVLGIAARLAEDLRLTIQGFPHTPAPVLPARGSDPSLLERYVEALLPLPPSPATDAVRRHLRSVRLRTAAREPGEADTADPPASPDDLLAACQPRGPLFAAAPAGTGRTLALFAVHQPGAFLTHSQTAMLHALRARGCATVLLNSVPDGIAAKAALADGLIDGLVTRSDHGRDVASWLLALALLGPRVEAAASILFCNDSFFGPFDDLAGLFAHHAALASDVWGLTDSWEQSWHIQSSFLVLSARALGSEAFARFRNSYAYPDHRHEVVRQGEVGLSRALVADRSLAVRVVAPYSGLARRTLDAAPDLLAAIGALAEQGVAAPEPGFVGTATAFTLKLLSDIREGVARNPQHVFWEPLLAHHRVPFVKRELLQHNPGGVPGTDRILPTIAATFGAEHARHVSRTCATTRNGRRLPDPTRLALRHPRALLLVFCALCWLPGWFAIPATDRDEARFAQATRQMLETGDVVDIRNGTEARNRKPIGIHWLQLLPAAAARAAGVAAENPIWPYRVPSLAGALVAVLATHALGRRLFGPREALLAAAMLAGSALLTVEAHLAKTDAALLATTTLAMAVLGRAYLARARITAGQAALFWLALGSGVLIKGPITPMIVALTALALVLADRRGRWLGALRPAWGVPLALAIVLPWLVAIELSTHGAFLRDAVGGDLGRKLAGGDDAHGAPPGYHLLLLSVTLFPTGFLVFRALPSLWAARRDAATRFLLAWAGPAWLVFELTPTKLPHYPLPLLPPLCLLAARWALQPGRPPERRWVAMTAMLLFAAACCVFGAGGVVLPFVVGAPRWNGLAALLAALAVAGAVLRMAHRPARAALAGLCAVPLLWWAVLAVELPRSGALWVSRAVAERAAGRPLAAVGYAEPSLLFAAGTGTRWLNAADAARWLAAAPGRVVAVEARQLAAFEAVAAPTAIGFARVDGFDYSNGRRVSVTLFAAMSHG